tara:strand:+ start:152 stop:373 length:222 start_codon:yes stop_codon:yes gene_type:complete
MVVRKEEMPLPIPPFSIILDNGSISTAKIMAVISGARKLLDSAIPVKRKNIPTIKAAEYNKIFFPCDILKKFK